MRFNIESRDSLTAARAGTLHLTHGDVQTPVFMPVGTNGTVKAITTDSLKEIGFNLILSNTYHLYLRPGEEVIEKSGGLHRFINWDRNILTDSGGFQVFSLSDLCKIRDDGVEFKSHLDGSKHLFTPQKVLDIQKVIGSDIMMILDQCTDYPISYEQAQDAIARTVNWAEKSIEYWKSSFDIEKQSIFAIVQGSVYKDLRSECAQRLSDMNFTGYAIGGLSVGEPKELYREITEHTVQYLPVDKPRYMMGVGSPLEILFAVRNGIDMFDCVMPTRNGRNGSIFTRNGQINIKNEKWKNDFSPIEEGGASFVDEMFSKAYLRHLIISKEMLGSQISSLHNIAFYMWLTREAQNRINEGTFPAWKREMIERLSNRP